MISENYFKRIDALLNTAVTEEEEELKRIASVIAEKLDNDGLLYTFGCGHSQLLAEEVFYRAGGLVRIAPMLDVALSLREGAVKSTECEDLRGYGELILDNYPICEKDCLLIISNSGSSQVVLDLCKEARKRGVTTIALTSSCYKGELARIAEYHIDNRVPEGDATIDPGIGTKMGAISGIVNGFILHWLSMEIAIKLNKPEVWMSSHIENGKEHNQQYIAEYRHRIKHL